MFHRVRTWLGWALWACLLLYDKLVVWLGRLAGPWDFEDYIGKPLREKAWPAILPIVAPMLTWEGARWGLFAVVSAALLWGHFGDRILKFMRRTQYTPNPTPATAGDRNANLRYEAAKIEMDTAPQPLAPHFPAGLYVGNMNVDASHLGDEFYLEIAILGFNAAGMPISIGEVDGTIGACELTSDLLTDRSDLPPATIMRDRTPTHDIANLSQFFVVLHQRIPRPVAEQFFALIHNGGQINLYFDSLNVMIRVASDPGTSARLSIWSGVRLRKNPERIVGDKIAIATGSLVLGRSPTN